MSQQPSLANPGQALWSQREAVQDALPRLESLLDVIFPINQLTMLPEDYPKLCAAVMDLQPDLVIEVGRLFGNSTCILAEAAERLGHTKVLSMCLTDRWFTTTLPKVEPLVSKAWLDNLDARVMNFVDLDVEGALKGHERVFVMVDAHSWEVAEFLLAEVMPRLRSRQHVVWVHDIVVPTHYSEVRERYAPEKPRYINRYNGKGIWKDDENARSHEFIFANGLAGSYPEFLALVDFAQRNGIDFRGVEEDVRREVDERPERRAELLERFGERMYSPFSGFAWFTLQSAPDVLSVSFPEFERVDHRLDELAQAVRADLGRHHRAGHPSLMTFARISAKVLLGRYNACLKD
jgi:cephalosporin hydroxylase